MRFVLLAAVAAGSLSAQIIDHTCTDLESIPGEWIDLVQSSIDSHYAHTSHGSQLTWGLHFIEEGNPFYAFIVGNGYLPSSPTAYCVFDGQEGEGYVTPDLYWETEDGLQLTRDVLDNNPSISTSMWCWCCQCDYYSQEQVQGYLDAMSLLEGEYPEVTFVYFTGNAQSEGSSGYNRHMRNQQIRAFCQANDRVLFDFEDLDSWWFNPSTSQWERNTYSYNGQEIPSEHPEFSGDEYGHTTAESCEQKGRAWWFMTALQAGWPGMGVSGPMGTGVRLPGGPPESGPGSGGHLSGTARCGSGKDQGSRPDRPGGVRNRRVYPGWRAARIHCSGCRQRGLPGGGGGGNRKADRQVRRGGLGRPALRRRALLLRRGYHEEGQGDDDHRRCQGGGKTAGLPGLVSGCRGSAFGGGWDSASTCDPQFGHSPEGPRMVNGVSQDGHLTNFTFHDLLPAGLMNLRAAGVAVQPSPAPPALIQAGERFPGRSSASGDGRKPSPTPCDGRSSPGNGCSPDVTRRIHREESLNGGAAVPTRRCFRSPRPSTHLGNSVPVAPGVPEASRTSSAVRSISARSFIPRESSSRCRSPRPPGRNLFRRTCRAPTGSPRSWSRTAHEDFSCDGDVGGGSDSAFRAFPNRSRTCSAPGRPVCQR